MPSAVQPEAVKTGHHNLLVVVEGVDDDQSSQQSLDLEDEAQENATLACPSAISYQQNDENEIKDLFNNVLTTPRTKLLEHSPLVPRDFLDYKAAPIMSFSASGIPSGQVSDPNSLSHSDLDLQVQNQSLPVKQVEPTEEGVNCTCGLQEASFVLTKARSRIDPVRSLLFMASFILCWILLANR